MSKAPDKPWHAVKTDISKWRKYRLTFPISGPSSKINEKTRRKLAREAANRCLDTG